MSQKVTGRKYGAADDQDPSRAGGDDRHSRPHGRSPLRFMRQSRAAIPARCVARRLQPAAAGTGREGHATMVPAATEATTRRRWIVTDARSPRRPLSIAGMPWGRAQRDAVPDAIRERPISKPSSRHGARPITSALARRCGYHRSQDRLCRRRTFYRVGTLRRWITRRRPLNSAPWPMRSKRYTRSGSK